MTTSTESNGELVGVAELAELLGVSKQAVSNWRSRERAFPQPLAELKSGPVWARSSIEAWARSKGFEFSDGRPTRTIEGPKRETVTVSLVNMKGGVGKSTLTANLGWHFAYNLSLRVLLVDLDPQFNLSQYILGLEKYKKVISENKATVYEVFEQNTPLVTRRKLPSTNSAICKVEEWNDGSYLHILPSRLELAWTLKNSHHKELQLAPYLEQFKGDYDLILIDCPPTESILTEAAYLASNFLLVPVKPDYLSTIGLPLLAESLNTFHNHHPDSPLEIAGVIFNAVQAGKNESRLAIKEVRAVAEEHDWYVFRHMISSSDSYPRGARSGTAISHTEYARSEKILEFTEFSAEFSKRIGL